MKVLTNTPYAGLFVPFQMRFLNFVKNKYIEQQHKGLKLTQTFFGRNLALGLLVFCVKLQQVKNFNLANRIEVFRPECDSDEALSFMKYECIEKQHKKF